MRIKTALASLFLTLNLAAITVGEIPKNVILFGEDGGHVKDSAIWDSSTIRDKLYIMFYVDPDEKDTNSHFADKLKKKNYNKDDYGSIAIINLAASWKPNFVIESSLEEKQKEFTNTTYVKDKNSVLVKEWEVEDDASNILVFSKDSRLLYYKAGEMSDEDMKQAFRIIEKNL